MPIERTECARCAELEAEVARLRLQIRHLRRVDGRSRRDGEEFLRLSRLMPQLHPEQR